MTYHETGFQIADVPIRFLTPTPLSVEPAFEGYRAEISEAAVSCVFDEIKTLRPRLPGSIEMYNDGMHRIFWSDNCVQQYFYIPYMGAAPAAIRQPDLHQFLEDGEEEDMWLYYRPQAARYFSSVMGCFNAAKIERLLIRGQRLILHACFLEHQGKAIAFTGPSGIGKSTQGSLWEQHMGAEVLNGDRMAFGMRGGVMTGFGLPVAGSSGVFTNRAVPLGCITVLQQAKKNEIVRLPASQALPLLMQQVTVNPWSSWYMDRAMTVLGQLLESVPVYLLRATPDAEAVQCLWEQLEKDWV